MADRQKSGLRKRIEEAVRKHEDRDTILIKYIGDDLRKPSPKAFREAVDLIIDLCNEVGELRSRADRAGFLIKELPSHHMDCGDTGCNFNKDRKCRFVDYSGERLIRLNDAHICISFMRGAKSQRPPDAPAGTVGSWIITKSKKKGGKEPEETENVSFESPEDEDPDAPP